MAIPANALVAPFDAIADRYDETFTDSVIGRAQRDPVWKELAATFHSGERVFEIGCGTGVDACFLAERGVSVIASDSSSQMIEVTRRRIAKKPCRNLIEPLLLTAEGISALSSHAPFDGAFSNFGALNCVEDLQSLAGDLARLVKPGGVAFLCLINRVCVWELAWYTARGNFQKAFRRLRTAGTTAQIANGVPVHVYYPSVRTLSRAFKPEFELQLTRGIGLVVPPSYLEPWACRHPHFMQLAAKVDETFSRFPGIRLLADHVLLKLRRR